ncbi:MAG: CHASE2 domain-containing protein [Phycisphaerae bacterium]|nr:CHASE2 domain-containing protein [Phycisphaerae bacterium]
MGLLLIAEEIGAEKPRRLAIKTLRKEPDSISVSMFEREQTLQRRLSKVRGVPGVLGGGVLSHGRRAGSPFFAMAWVTDPRPASVFMDGRSLPERLVLMSMICDVVADIHRHDVLHCDLKPGNMLFDQHSEAWVVDFGIALSLRDGERVHTGGEIGWCRGTPVYSAPEQCDARCDAFNFTPSLDTYSLAVMAYEAATGRIPYGRNLGRGATWIEAREVMHPSRRMTWYEDGLPMMHPLLRWTISRELRADPRRRRGSARSMGAWLRFIGRWACGLDVLTASVVLTLAMAVGLGPDWNSVSPRLNGLIERAAGAGPVGVGGANDFDQVFVLSIEDGTNEALPRDRLGLRDEWGFGPGLMGRPVIGRVLDELKRLGATVVLPDFNFVPAAPGQSEEAAARHAESAGLLRDAIDRFESRDDPARVILMTRHWPRDLIAPGIDPLLDLSRRTWGPSIANMSPDSRWLRVEVVFQMPGRPPIPSSMLLSVAAMMAPGVKPEFVCDFDRGVVQAVFPNSTVKRLEIPLNDTLTGEQMRLQDQSREPTEYRSDDRFGLVVFPVPDPAALARVTMELGAFLSLPESRARSLVQDRIVLVGSRRSGSSDQVSIPGSGRLFGVEIKAASIQALADASGVFRVNRGVHTTGINAATPRQQSLGVFGTALAGVWFGRRSILRVKRGGAWRWRVAGACIVGAVVIVVGSIFSVMAAYGYAGMLWNPLGALAAAFAALAFASVAPWLCGNSLKENH